MTTLALSIVRDRKSAASLRREQEDAKLRKLDWYKKYPGITRVWLHPSSGKRGYAGGVLRQREFDGSFTYNARTFDEASNIKQISPFFKTHRAALLWLADVNDL